MALHDLQFGCLFSSAGSYEPVARSKLNGALLAALATKLLERDIRYLAGCYSSSSRKEVIPLFEKNNACAPEISTIARSCGGISPFEQSFKPAEGSSR
jgi:hypothetical protein